MSLILDAYDSDKDALPLSKARENLSADSSLVEIVDHETQTILNITVGSKDRKIMSRIVKLWSYAEHRYVPPGKQSPRFGFDPVDAYCSICDALLELNSPEIYRKAELQSKEGYLIESAALQTVVDAAKKTIFANVRLAGCTSSYSAAAKDMVYTRVTVEFNREPWEPPVFVEPTPSITKPISFFRNLWQRISRTEV